TWQDRAPGPAVRGTEPESAAVRPLRSDGTRHETYAGAVEELAPPSLLPGTDCPGSAADVGAVGLHAVAVLVLRADVAGGDVGEAGGLDHVGVGVVARGPLVP